MFNDPQIGKIWDERFEVLGEIGRGGMGAVYLVRQLDLERVAAIKVLNPDVGKSFASRFSSEGKLLARLKHRNIVSIYQFGNCHPGIRYLVMEYVKGQTIAELLEASGAIPWRRALEIALQICEGMYFAHSSNVIHRDLKPSNVILEENAESVKILDFGLAATLGEVSKRLTESGQLLGTVYYASPEQCKGNRVDQRSDIYSLGCVLYEMLTGRKPFDANSFVAVMRKHLSELPPPIAIAGADSHTSEALNQIVFKAMSKSRESRYADMKQFSRDIGSVLEGHTQEVLKGCQTTIEQNPGAKGQRSRLQRSISTLAIAVAAAFCAGLLCFKPTTGSRPGNPISKAIQEQLATGELEGARSSLSRLVQRMRKRGSVDPTDEMAAKVLIAREELQWGESRLSVRDLSEVEQTSRHLKDQDKLAQALSLMVMGLLQSGEVKAASNKAVELRTLVDKSGGALSRDVHIEALIALAQQCKTKDPQLALNNLKLCDSLCSKPTLLSTAERDTEVMLKARIELCRAAVLCLLKDYRSAREGLCYCRSLASELRECAVNRSLILWTCARLLTEVALQSKLPEARQEALDCISQLVNGCSWKKLLAGRRAQVFLMTAQIELDSQLSLAKAGNEMDKAVLAKIEQDLDTAYDLAAHQRTSVELLVDLAVQQALVGQPMKARKTLGLVKTHAANSNEANWKLMTVRRLQFQSSFWCRPNLGIPEIKSASSSIEELLNDLKTGGTARHPGRATTANL